MYKYIKFTTNRSASEAKEIFNQRIADSLAIFHKYKNFFYQRNCFICGESDFIELDKFHGTYQIVRCKVCSSESVNPLPNDAALSDYYNNSKCNLMLDQLLKSRYKKESDFIMDDRVKIVLQLISKIDNDEIHLLEVGCGSGAFLSKLNHFIKLEFPNRNVRLTGIDIDENAINSSVNVDLNLKAINAEAYVQSTKNSYDIIIHFELIEHLADPFTFMKSLYRLLKDGGVVYFTTPNAEGLEMLASGYNDYRPLAHSIFPPMHLNAFSISNLKLFSLRCGFRMVELATPGKLDIDMLSLFEGHLDPAFELISKLDEDTKGLIQYLVSYLNGSSHMRCILMKNSMGCLVER